MIEAQAPLAWHLRPVLLSFGLGADGAGAGDLQRYAERLYSGFGYPLRAFFNRDDATGGGAPAAPVAARPRSIELADLPDAVRRSVQDDYGQLKDLLDRSYLPFPGDTLRSSRLCLLPDFQAGASAATVAYVRTYGRAEIYYVLTHLGFDEASAKPLIVPVTVSPPPPRPMLRAALGSSPEMGVAKEVATNLAFALPSPFGPVGAAALSVIFGDLLGSSGPSMLQQISDLIGAAVQQIENFLKDAQYDQARKDFTTFLNSSLDYGKATDPMSRDVAEHVLPPILDSLGSNLSIEHGHLRNTLAQLCNVSLTDVSQPVPRGSDIALSTVFVGVTAILMSYYLKARLSGQLAAYYSGQVGASATGTDQEKADDLLCQTYLGEYRRTVGDLYGFVHGAGAAVQAEHATETAAAAAAVAAAIEKAAREISRPFGLHATRQASPGIAQAVQSSGIMQAAAQAFQTSGIAQAVQSAGIAQAVGDGPKPLSFDDVVAAIKGDNQGAVAAQYGSDQKPDISELASSGGWASAMETFIQHRRAARLLQIGSVGSFNDRKTECHYGGGSGGGGACHTTGQAGWQFQDDGTGEVRKFPTQELPATGCCHQNSHEIDHHDDAVSTRLAHIDEVVGAINGDYGSDLQTVQGWRDNTQKLLDALPPPQPVASIVLSGTWGGTAPPGSLWAKAELVSYACARVSKAHPDVPSQRSDFSPETEVKGRGKPTLKDIPVLGAADLKVQIWRRFSYRLGNDPAAKPGLPELVAEFTAPGVDSWTDPDPAPDPAGK